jgi:glutathione S-transferase
MDIRLHDWGPSPFCLKVRAILEYKQVRYQRLPALKTLLQLRRRTPGKVPVLDVDGRLVTDSTDIAYELDRLFPEPAIVPREPRDRALCHALEDWADEALYFIGLWYQWIDPPGAAMVPRAFGPTIAGRLAYRLVRRTVRAQVRGQGTGRKSPQQVQHDLQRELAAADALLAASPFLLGERPLLCDFALMGQLVYLTRPPGSAPEVARHPNITAFLERMKSLRAG